MITFDYAQKILRKNEGGYVDDPDDSGGETYRGISRVFNSKWIGWSIIDDYKSKPGFPISLYKDQSLNNFVEEFYFINFWKKNRVDSIQNDLLKIHFYDMCVNAGSVPATKLLQRIVCVQDDGVVGDKTIAAINNFSDQKMLSDKYADARKNYYIESSKKKNNKKYLETWFNRIDYINQTVK